MRENARRACRRRLGLLLGLAVGLAGAQLAVGQAPDDAISPLPPITPVAYRGQQPSGRAGQIPPSAEQFQQVLQRLDAQQRELDALRGQPVSFDSASYEQNSVASKPYAQDTANKPSPLEKRLTDLENSMKADKNKQPLIKLGGFFQLDTGYYHQDTNSYNTYGDMQDGTGFRRTRLQAYGSVTESTNYIVEMDFAVAGRPSFLDVWGEQKNLGMLGTVRIGQFRQPTTMDALTSIRHLEFLERNAAFQAVDPFRRVGIMSYNVNDAQTTTWATSVYRTGFTFFNPTTGVDNYGTLGDTRYATFIGDNGGYSTATRVTHLLWYDEPAEGRYLAHVGGGYNYSQIGGNGGTPGATNGGQYIARAIPEFFVGSPEAGGAVQGGTPFVSNTGNINATSFDFYHLEAAGQYGAAHFQTEYLATRLNTDTGGGVFLDGAYFQCGYFLTGENCGYNRQTGVMDYNVKPFSEFFGLGNHRGAGICGWGAWEIAFRYSYLDLSRVTATAAAPPANAGTAGGNPNPGILNSGTVALNWWWNQNTRVQFNYINANYNSNLYGKSDTDIYAARFQVEF